MKKSYLIPLLFSMVYLFTVNSTSAQHSHNHDEPGHHTGLHFAHPLFTESVSPDTKMRLDYQLQYPGSTSETELEGEYAFSRIFSLEAGIHFDSGQPSLATPICCSSLPTMPSKNRAFSWDMVFSWICPPTAITRMEQR